MVEQPPTTEELDSVVRLLGRVDGCRIDDSDRVDQIRVLEQIKSAAAGAQAKVTAAFRVSQEAAQREAGAAVSEVGKGIASQVGLAKRESPARARRYVDWAGVLTGELPETLAALTSGRISEWRAMIVARETAWLSRADRRAVDAALAPRIESLGDRGVEAEAKKLAYRLDPHGYLARIVQAEADRRVTLRPAPDTMSQLGALLPVAQGVSVFKVLNSEADARRAQGDERTRGQIMADTLVARVTGQPAAEAVPVAVNLVMTDQTLFNRTDSAASGSGAGPDEPGIIEGCGPIPADLARRLVLDAAQGAEAWVRRLYTAPETGQLVAMDSRSRAFPDGLAQFLVVRDQTCRTPWCDAPIRHRDHPVPVEAGGPTSEANGQGLCEACNYAKEAPGWSAQPRGTGAGEGVEITTPTGHKYLSHPPDPPGAPPSHPPDTPPPDNVSPLEQYFREIIDAA